jgi:hypothetical protein
MTVFKIRVHFLVIRFSFSHVFMNFLTQELTTINYGLSLLVGLFRQYYVFLVFISRYSSQKLGCYIELEWTYTYFPSRSCHFIFV